MITIYHNPKCRKSREGLEYLKAKGQEFTIVEYLKNPLTKEVLEDILVKLNIPAKELVRTQEDVFKEKFKGKNFTNDEWVRILLENPKLIQRPIIVKEYKAILGQPLEEIDKLFKK
ncbi:MAG: arsenate reductase (glutaredoxin) [Bacteroidales bacterium]|nr:arsenate reductase (glutaredoxin) [Bacteroidales bacterium]